MKTWVRRGLAGGTGAVLIAGAIFVHSNEIDVVAAHAPIDVDGTVGEHISGRNIAATLNAVYLTPEIRVLRRGWDEDEADVYRAHDNGVFVVFDVTASSVVANGMAGVDLVIGDKTFGQQYAGLPPNLGELTPGVPFDAGFSFEIPVDLEKSTAQFGMVAQVQGNERGDSRLAFTVDLATVTRLPVLHYRDDKISA